MTTDLETLGRTVKQAQHRQQRAIETALSKIGTTLVQWDALRAIARTPGASAHALAMATFQTDQAFGTLANRLDAQGLIRREAGEGRRIDHHLTEAGERMLANGNVVATRVRRELFEPLSEAERQTLAGLLLKLTSAPVPGPEAA